MLQCWSWALSFSLVLPAWNCLGRLNTEGSRRGSQMLMAVTVSWRNLPHSSAPIWNWNPFPSVTACLLLSVFPCWIPISLNFHFVECLPCFVHHLLPSLLLPVLPHKIQKLTALGPQRSDSFCRVQELGFLCYQIHLLLTWKSLISWWQLKEEAGKQRGIQPAKKRS